MVSLAIDAGTAKRIDELRAVGIRAYDFARQESRRLGIPNVYSTGGVLYWELPDGTLSRTDPYEASKDVTSKSLSPRPDRSQATR